MPRRVQESCTRRGVLSFQGGQAPGSLARLEAVLQGDGPVEHQSVRAWNLCCPRRSSPAAGTGSGRGPGRRPERPPACSRSSTSRELGFRQSRKFLSPASGSGSVNRLSYRRTSASTAVAASTQWMVAPFTLRPSAGSPPRDCPGHTSPALPPRCPPRP